MTAWALIQVVVDLGLLAGGLVLVLKRSKRAQDDPRLSRGLQLLQSKISVLEDLSDRTEIQVKQLVAILDEKSRQLQQKIQDAEAQIQVVDQSMKRSLEVAEIFQDKIPHEEIIARRNSLKYIQAARLAHQGCSADEIQKKVDLPLSEIEFIAKVNREQLMFDDKNLPAWAQVDEAAQSGELEDGEPFIEMNDGSEEYTTMEPAVRAEPANIDLAPEIEIPASELAAPLAMRKSSVDYSKVFDSPAADLDMSSIRNLDEQFKAACKEYELKAEEVKKLGSEPSQLLQAIKKMKDKIEKSVEKKSQPRVEDTRTNGAVRPPVSPSPAKAANDQGKSSKPVARNVEIRKVQFPRIDVDITKNLG